MTKNIIALIPARGGSKGIPKKNIKKFMGIPLIAHSIKYALSCEKINEIYVTTDNTEIAEICSNLGAKIIKRPNNISSDTATTESAIEHALSVVNTNPDIIVLLQPTSPLRPKKTLQKALKIFMDKNYDSLLSISPTHKFFWQISTVAGVFLGTHIPTYLNLEFAIPLTFIAIILPKLKSLAQICTAVTASIIAIFGQELPYGLWIIVASISGMFVGGLISQRKFK